MITITKTQKKLTVSGHAGYAERGKDIVCEAVTAQVQTLFSSIQQLTYDTPNVELHSGYFEIDIEELSEKSLFLVRSFIIGMQLLHDGYPKNVGVVIEE